jgi:asparaginyl-tRNA synthetase
MHISEILSDKHVGKKVEVRGWVYRRRVLKNKTFLVVRDSTDVIQCVSDDPVEKATVESSVIVTGMLKKDKRAPTGYEIEAKKIEVIGTAERFPITKDQSVEFLLDVRHLWLRSRKLTAVMKIKETVLAAAREWFANNDFHEVTPPIIVSGQCEGGSTLFSFKYFDKKAYLSQSAQLYLESLIFPLEKVYSLTPSFRAEKSRTRRHVAEYWHLEGEMAWVDNEGNMKIQEELVSYIVKKVLEKNRKELAYLKRDTKPLERVKPPFHRFMYDEAIKTLQKKGLKIKWGDDLGADEEREFTIDMDKPAFVMNYPRGMKAFYMKVNPDNPKTVLCSDLLAPEGFGEIIGASQREDDEKNLLENMKMFKLDRKDYEWYIDLRKFGSVPHSGFGLGIERIVTWICGLEHIRDTLPYPRMMNRFYP